MVAPASPSYKQQERGWMRYPSGGLLWFLYRAGNLARAGKGICH